MKKILAVSIVLFIFGFVLGIFVSDFVQQTVNSIFGSELFYTKKEMKNRLAELDDKYKTLEQQMSRRQVDLSNLVKEMNNKDYFTLTKESLLSTPSIGDGSRGKILLKPPSNEMLLKPTTTDDPSVNAVKEGFNSKIKAILDVSKGILRNKITRLNVEVMKVNGQLKEKNMELNEKLKEVDAYKTELDKQKKYIVQLEGIQQDLKKAVGDLETKIEHGRLKVSFKGDILFDSGKHQIRDEGKKLLMSVFQVLKKSTQKNDIFIAGHTDNVPIKEKFRHKYDSNWDLSTYRAIEVVKYLIAEGINPQHLTAAGYGEFKPLVDNRVEKGRKKNRRVELFVIPRIIQREE